MKTNLMSTVYYVNPAGAPFVLRERKDKQIEKEK